MRHHLKLKAWLLLTVFIAEMLIPTFSFSIGSGPSQPEMAKFTPAGTSEMVNPFTGDFSYNIPLMDVEGYPINIAYNSGVTMEQEASWVGLGWNLNVGSVNRSVRGLPDDFNGDEIENSTSMRPMKIIKAGGGITAEIFASESVGINASTGLSFIHNNYKGFGLEFNNSVGASVGRLSANSGIDINSLDGTTVNASLGVALLSLNSGLGSLSFGGGLNTGYNTRTGQSLLSLGTNASYSLGGYLNVESVGSSSTTLLPIGMETYTPFPSFKLKSKTVDFSGTLGGTAMAITGGARIFGSITTQEIAEKDVVTPSYGYMYLENSNQESITDFNREKSVILNKTITNLSPSSLTYDIFSVSGQGIGGVFRPFRNDLGVVSDPSYNFKSSDSKSIGGEFGLGLYFHGGLTYNTVEVESQYGRWTDDNKSRNLNFQGEVNKNLSEKIYFKSAGDLSESSGDYFNNVGGLDAFAYQMEDKKIRSNLVNNKGGNLSGLNGKNRFKRDARSKVFTYLTADIADKFAIDSIRSTSGSFYEGDYSYETYPRISNVKKEKHISEITQIQDNGERYVFGIPVYNLSKKEVTYSTNQKIATIGDNRIDYNSTQASKNNEEGKDWFFSSKKIPGFAHSYLLTSLLSSDYQDVTGDGVTNDDMGNAYKFDYTRTSTNYKWRVPYTGVTLMKGYKSDALDQKASYSYGSKELWYLHTIQSKNQVAEFYTSNREDALGTVGEQGGRDLISANARTQQLDSILLFDKLDRLQNKGAAIPIKKIEFTYDYSLCKGVENQVDITKGKLTLKKIQVSYGRNLIGNQSPYIFNYSSVNPNYNPDHMDRWGNYKPKYNNPESLPNEEYPYVLQNNDSLNNSWSSAWSLNEIFTPTGAKLNVEYECDDYGYVMNEEAMQMFSVVGAGPDEFYNSAISDHRLYDNPYIFIEKPKDLPANLSQNQLKEIFLGNEGFMKSLYFKFLTEIDDNKFEYVPGFTSVTEIGYASNTTDYLFIKISDIGPNAISQTAWSFFRQNLFEVLYQQPNVNNTGIESLVRGIKANVNDIKQMFSSVTIHLKNREVADKFKIRKSLIRLNSPLNSKKGGGSRVKTIMINDQWNSMSGEGENNFYGQEYFYKTKDDVFGEVSSGVASYEPMIGNDENPFRLPTPFILEEAKGKIPAIEAYLLKPFGESFLPSPIVGYSDITIKNINRESGKSSKAITKHKYYTAKDFPAIIDQTTIQKRNKEAPKTVFSFPFSDNTTKSRFTASQGYSIVLNDMHGKPKSSMNYMLSEKLENNKLISIPKLIGGSEYNYKFNKTSKGNILDNQCEVLNVSGNLETKRLGVEVDVTIENRATYEKNTSIARHANVDVFPIPFPFAPIPLTIIKGNYKKITDIRESKYQSITKVVQQYGIIESVKIFTDQYEQIIYNKIYDGTTGKVLLSETKDEHLKSEFQFDLPAYMANNHKLMGPSYRTIDLKLKIYPKPYNDDCNRDLTAFSLESKGLINEGDEVIITYNNGTKEKAWVKLDTNNKYLSPINNCNTDTINVPFIPNYRRLLTTFSRQSSSSVDSIKPFIKGLYRKQHGQILEKVKVYHLKNKWADKYQSSLSYLVDTADCEIAKTNSYALGGSHGGNAYIDKEEINHIYHSDHCSIAKQYFYNDFGIDSLNGNSQTIFNGNNGNLDLSDNFLEADTFALGSFFDLKDTLHATIENYGCNVERDSITTDPISIHYPSYNSLSSNYVFRNRSNYSIEYNSCSDHSNFWDYFLREPNIPLFYSNRRNPLWNGAPVGYSPGPNSSIVFEKKNSRSSLRIIDKKSFESFLEQDEQLYLVEYLHRDNQLGDTTKHYYIENGRGYKELPYKSDATGNSISNSYCLSEDSLWDQRATITQVEIDSFPCKDNFRFIDRNGIRLNTANMSFLRIVRPAFKNQISATTASITSNKNPMKFDLNGKFLGLKNDLDSINIINTTAQLFKDGQDIRYTYNPSNNPFISNSLGSLMPDSILSFFANRSQSSDILNGYDGYLEELPELWTNIPCYNGIFQPNFSIGGSASGWKFKQKPTKFNSSGEAVEYINNIGIPSTQIMDSRGLVRIQASNSFQHNVGSDGFESYHDFVVSGKTLINDFKFSNQPVSTQITPLLDLGNQKFDIINYNDNEIVKGISHSGNYSIFVNMEPSADNSNLQISYRENTLNNLEHLMLGEINGDLVKTINVNEANEKLDHFNSFTSDLDNQTIAEINDGLNNSRPIIPLNLNTGDSIGSFKPDNGKYIVSIWVKELLAKDKPYAGESPEIEIINNGVTILLKPKGPIIDGWQKIEGTFNYDSSSTLTINLIGGEWGAFFDDFRIHGFESNVRSFVYDKYSNRLKAMLDENNFATFYEYDFSGIPTQVKRETTEGILTISESRQSITKKPN